MARLVAGAVLIAALLTACSSGGDDGVLVSAVVATPARTATAEEAASSGVEAEPTAEPGLAVTIAAVGDLMFAREVVGLMLEHGAGYPFARVRQLFDGADIIVGNLEGTFTERGDARPKTYNFRAPPGLAAVLDDAGFDVVSLANNHSCDFGATGLTDTQQALDAQGVQWFGAGVNGAGALRPASVVVNGSTVSFVGYNGVPELEAPPLEDCFTPATSFLDEVRQRRSAGEIVVAMLHFGMEYQPAPDAAQRELARAAVDAGAQLVIGSHPHVLQGWERYAGGVILYSLGNFVFDLDRDDLATLGAPPFETAVALITFSPDGDVDVEFRPAFIDPDENRPRPATPEEAEHILDRLREIER